jgi:hypothetical protein
MSLRTDAGGPQVVSVTEEVIIVTEQKDDKPSED